MKDTPNTEPHRTTDADRQVTRLSGKAMGVGLALIVVAFFIGFFWQFYQATTVRQTLAATERELVVERLRVQLSNAAIAAQAGRYEAARREMSDFYSRVQTEEWALPDQLRTVTREFLAMRDDVITGLSRSNPEFAGVLFGMLDRFEEAVPAVGAPRPAEPAQDAPAPPGG